jgi:ornithine carbamoyltransferase
MQTRSTRSLSLSVNRPTLRADVVPSFQMSARHFLTGEELSPLELQSLLQLAAWLKSHRGEAISPLSLTGKSVALVFEKPSLRTRVSFTVALQELGGNPIEIVTSNTKGEEPQDEARVLSGYCHGIMLRTFAHQKLVTMAEYSRASIINGLSDLHHPCQALADLMTLQERFGELNGLKLSYVGDGNNVLHSLLLLAPAAGVEVHFSCPKGYGPDAEVLARATARAEQWGVKIVAHKNPQSAVTGTHAVYTDVWTSMGFEDETKARKKAFKGYCVNEALMKRADSGAVVMHCLPMIRGQEISETLPDSAASAIWDQAENRLHAQKALLIGLLG